MLMSAHSRSRNALRVLAVLFLLGALSFAIHRRSAERHAGDVWNIIVPPHSPSEVIECPAESDGCRWSVDPPIEVDITFRNGETQRLRSNVDFSNSISTFRFVNDRDTTAEVMIVATD